VAMVLNPDKTPFTPAKVIDLMHQEGAGAGQELEIRKVLPPGAHGVLPTKYIPLGG